MVGIYRLLEIRCMALIAVRVLELIVVVDMARLTRSADVRAGKRKSRRVMVELRGLPPRCRVTGLALLRESAAHMVRIPRRCEIGQVARHAAHRLAGEDIVAMAALTPSLSMCTREREARDVMIIQCPLPPLCCMAGLAIRGEVCRGMIGIGRSGEIRLMTRHALAWCPFEDLVLVTRNARNGCMRASQRKRGQIMVEPASPCKCRDLMALDAVGGKACCRMVR